jgi:uncharacterized protein YciI
MKYWLYTLTPSRPSFPADITEAETAILHDHFAYWSRLSDEGKAIVFGPVSHPRNDFGGVGIIELPDDEDPNVLGSNDPWITADVGFRFEIMAMPAAVIRPSTMTAAADPH